MSLTIKDAIEKALIDTEKENIVEERNAKERLETLKKFQEFVTPVYEQIKDGVRSISVSTTMGTPPKHCISLYLEHDRGVANRVLGVLSTLPDIEWGLMPATTETMNTQCHGWWNNSVSVGLIWGPLPHI